MNRHFLTIRKRKNKILEKVSSKKFMRLAELSTACGLSPQTIRYYLLLGLIGESQKSRGGQRLFDQASVRRVKLINKLNRSGYPLAEIRKVFLKKKLI